MATWREALGGTRSRARCRTRRSSSTSDGFVEHELRHLFAQLLRHRTFATRLIGAVSYDEAGTPSAGAVVRVTGEANRRVVGALIDIDDLLLELISPTDEIFDEADVIARHGYIDDHTLTQAFADEW